MPRQGYGAGLTAKITAGLLSNGVVETSAPTGTPAVTRRFARVLVPYPVLPPRAVVLNFNTWMKRLFQMFTTDPMWQ